MNLNKLSALALVALLTACASTQEKEAQTAKAEQAEKALDELNRQVRSQSEMLSTSAKQTAQSQKAIEELNKQLKDQSDVLTTTLSKATGGTLTATGTDISVNVVSDSTPPVFQNAVTNTAGDQITLTYNEALSATMAATGAFAVSVAGSNRNVTGVSVSGSTVVLTLASAVTNGQTVTVGYTDPTANNDVNAVQDIAGNDAVTLAATTAVTNNVPDTTAPIRQSAATNSLGTQVILTYSEALSASTASPGDFLVKANGTDRTISSVSVSGNTVVLTLASPALLYGESVAVGYADPTGNNDVNAVQDSVGNDAASFSLTTVTNNVVDAIAPTFQSAATNQYGQIILSYDEALSATTAATTAFAVTVGGAPRTVSAAQVIGSTVLLTLATAVANGDTVTVSYTDPSANNDSNAVQDSAGNDAVSLAAAAVTNNVPDTTPPVFQSAATDNTGKIVLTYNEALSSMASGTSAFYVYLNGGAARNTVTNVAVSGNTVILTLTTPIVYGNTATVQYVDSDGFNTVYATQDSVGNDAVTMGIPANVVNNMPETVPPVFQSAATSSDGTQVILTYNEALSATMAGTGAFAVSVAGSNRNVTGVSVSGSTVVLTLGSAVTNGQTVTVGYTDPTANNDVNAVQDIAGNDAITLAATTAVTNNVPNVAPTDVGSFNIILASMSNTATDITGTTGNDYLVSNTTSHTIIGGQGNDVMWAGGYGDIGWANSSSYADVFKWNSGDAGTAGATDTIKDFVRWDRTSGTGDQLNITNLLAGGYVGGSILANWVKSITTGQTVNGVANSSVRVIDIDGTGSGTVTQVIVLEGVDLLAGLTGTYTTQLGTLKTNGVIIA